jgi:ABC-type nitrate/sulfonate/bicarbonate transport system substrate-binding protein
MSRDTMQDYPAYDLNIIFRAGHSQFWELADKAGILRKMRLTLCSSEETDDPRVAEAALFNGQIDFICGNHITPYKWVGLGKPIVCLASPSNAVGGRVVTREPVASLADFKARGIHVADTNLVSSQGIAGHGRLNHILHVMNQGYREDEIEWLEMGQSEDPGTQARLIEAVKSGKADAAFVGRVRGDLAAEGLHVVNLPTLEMINGTTITTSYEALNKKEGLAERLVQAMVETIHYARMHPEQAQRFLDVKDNRPYSQHGGRVSTVANAPIKPYPSGQGVLNAYALSCMRYEEARAANPLALWDTHYLRDLDLSGFIDELIQEEPPEVQARYGPGNPPEWVG